MSTVSEKGQLNPLRLSMAPGPEPSVITCQKLLRLKVNRIAIVQSLKVEHVLEYLVKAGVFTEDEKTEIESSGTTQEKARRLLDLLPQRDNTVDWYGHFRFALKNPDVRSSEVKKKYQILIEFLDNTIIQAPPKITRTETVQKPAKGKLPHFERLPSIADSTTSRANTPENGLKNNSRVTFSVTSANSVARMTASQTSKRDVLSPDLNENLAASRVNSAMSDSEDMPQNRLKNFTSLIEAPTEHFKKLENSSDTADQVLFNMEQEVLATMKRLELTHALFLRDELEGEIFLTEPVATVLSDESLYHLFYKYLNHLKQKHRMHIMRDISISYCNFMSVNSDAEAWPVFKIGFRLSDFLLGFGQYSSVEAVLLALISQLVQNPELDNWMGIYEAFVKIMEINITNVNFQRVDWANDGAEEMTRKIQMVSFGKDILDESAHKIELSRLMQERGSVKPALELAQQALRTVEPWNIAHVVGALCNASRTHVMDHNAKKARPLAIEAVRQAKFLFGFHHPMYVKALLCFCHFCSEFHHKEIAIQAAELALQTTEKIYNVDSVVVAEAHQAVAVALMTNQRYEDERYFTHALEAWKCAMGVIEGGHPSLAPFKYTLAMALYWRSLYGKPEDSDANIVWSESEGKSALAMFEVSWGMYSLKTGRTHVLLGLIYFRMKKYEEAEKTLQTALTLYKLCAPAKSNYTMFAKSVRAIVLKVLGEPQVAIDVAKEVVDETNCGGIHLTWVKNTYDLLIEALESTGSSDEVEIYKKKLSDWVAAHPLDTEPVMWEELNERPGTFEDFMKRYDVWQEKSKVIKKGIKQILNKK